MFDGGDDFRCWRVSAEQELVFEWCVSEHTWLFRVQVWHWLQRQVVHWGHRLYRSDSQFSSHGHVTGLSCCNHPEMAFVLKSIFLTYVCMHALMYLCTHIFTNTYMHTYTHTHVYAHMCMHADTCRHYLCTHTCGMYTCVSVCCIPFICYWLRTMVVVGFVPWSEVINLLLGYNRMSWKQSYNKHKSCLHDLSVLFHSPWERIVCVYICVCLSVCVCVCVCVCVREREFSMGL